MVAQVSRDNVVEEEQASPASISMTVKPAGSIVAKSDWEL